MFFVTILAGHFREFLRNPLSVNGEIDAKREFNALGRRAIAVRIIAFKPADNGIAHDSRSRQWNELLGEELSIGGDEWLAVSP